MALLHVHAHGFVCLLCHVFEALSSKKKSKSKKEPKPAKPQGRTFIHQQNNSNHLVNCALLIYTAGPLFSLCSSILFMYVVTAAEEDSDDMFKPPKMDDDDFSPFGGKSGLFSGGRGLFDDDEEVCEANLPSELPLLQSRKLWTRFELCCIVLCHLG